MKMKYLVSSAILTGMLLASCSDSYEGAPRKTTDTGEEAGQVAAVAVEKTNNMQVYAHYMPWFETPSTSKDGTWGYHWKMKFMHPDQVDDSGKREIASHYYPLTGPYASGDEAILDYQCLLMKYSGIDGVMVDWYGVNSDNDIAYHKTNTEKLFKAIKRAGLKMAVVYEDNTLSGDYVTAARTDLSYLATTFFRDDAYTKVDGKPLLLDFGPQKMQSGKDWYRAFSILGTHPVFLTLNYSIDKANNGGYNDNAQGEFEWVDPNPNYERAKDFKYYVGGAMPGFKDFYKKGEDNEEGYKYTFYDSKDGALFQRQLDAVKKAGLSMLQISTWNDYGEGTIIEPTQEFGYKYLTMLQQFTGVKYQQSDLELIYNWYKARVAHPDDPKVKEAYNDLVQLKTSEAKAIIDAFK